MTRNSLSGRARPQLEALEDRCLLTAQQFVTGLYADLLDRSPSSAEVNGWVQQMANGLSPGQVTTAFTTSTEFRTNLVVDHYRHFLDRLPAAPEVQFWVDRLNAGLRDEALTAAFLGSGEYLEQQQGGAIVRPLDGGARWLEGVYRDLLGRELDETGRQAWLAAYRNGATRESIALSIATSEENDTRVIDAVFADLLGRAPDPAGLASWSSALDTGLTWTQLRAQIAVSTEYINVVAGGNVQTL
jgi:hypothetical protein